MNVPHVSNDLQPIVEEITRRFQGRIDALYAPRLNEVYFHAQMELVPGFCAQLYKKWNGRLVSLFADDARAQDGAFHLYYVFALDAAHGFFILRVPVSPDAASIHVAHQRLARRQLAGARNTGHVRPQARRPSQSPPLRAAR